MNTPQPAPHVDDPTPASAGALFARTHDGLLVAKVGDNAFAMMPSPNGRYYLASAWRLRAPMEEWTRADFYSHGGELQDEAAFRARVHENAEHQRQRAVLGRREIRSRANTPWGASQGATLYSDGVVMHSTAGHGGFHLDAAHNAKVHPALRAPDGWYEEDCAWAAVAQAWSCSPITNGAAPTAPSGTGIPTPGRRSMAARFNLVNHTRRTAATSSVITPPTGS